MARPVGPLALVALLLLGGCSALAGGGTTVTRPDWYGAAMNATGGER